MKELKKMPIIKGRVPRLYNADVTVDMCELLNAHSAAINHLAEENRALRKEVERLSSNT